jgi:RimJ/RimL family protein N-acetyltransferase
MIYGERIRFRANERDDLPIFVRWLNDHEVRDGISIYRPFSMAEEEGWFEDVLKRPQDERPLLIEVREDKDGEEKWVPIGNCGFHEIDWRNRSAEFGIMIGEKSYWNQGYGTEAVRLLMKHGFDALNLNRIYLRVFENNHRAIRVYEKVGFVHEGRFRQAEFKEGEYVDILFLSILRSEWQG